MAYRPPAPRACKPAPGAVSGCYIPPAIAQSQSGPPSTNRRSHHSGIRSLSFPLKLSQYPFSQGLPGSMYNVPVPSFSSHWHKSRARNSGLPILRSTRIARHSLVYSSGSVRSRSVLPSCTLALTKSWLQAWFRCSGRSRTQKPPFSQSRLRGLCFCGTFKPSRRQIRCTRSFPTGQPELCSNAVIRR